MIKRYISNKSNTISNKFSSGLVLRTTGSNTGLADAGEIFLIYGQAASSSSEISRMMVEFPISSISTDRTAGTIPQSGSVSFYLNMFNAKHPFTLPRKFYLAITPLSRSWDQGNGLDLDEGTDLGISNWNQASSNSSGIISWDNAGGDYFSGSYIPGTTLPHYSYYFDKGYEDMSLDVTSYVEEVIAGTYPNYGLLLRLSGSENVVSSSYTKHFYTQGSEYFFKRPLIEARWNDSTNDNRANFVVSSSNLSATDNTNIVYMYNFFRGQLKNLPEPVTSGAIYIQIYDDRISGSLLTSTPITGGAVATGIYSASFVLSTTASYIYDRWYGTLLTPCYHTGTIEVNNFNGSSYNVNPKYLISIPNIKDSYSQDEVVRFRLFTRQKDWMPTIYNVATADPQTEIIQDIYYCIRRTTDELTVVEYGTGSINHTRLSYDVSGSYFDFDMDLLEKGYMYNINFVVKLNSSYQEQKETFRFRVD